MSSDEKAKASGAAGAHSDDEGGGGLLPAIVVGAGILVVAALLIFDFGDDDDKEGKPGDRAAAAAQGRDGAGGGKGKGGVKGRDYDAAKRGESSRINPAIKLPNVGMAPGAPPPEEPPPDFQNTAEEIEWYEDKLAKAIQVQEQRQTNLDRLPRAREKVENGPNPTKGMAAFERREKIVQENYDKAAKKVAEIEAKLAALRGE